MDDSFEYEVQGQTAKKAACPGFESAKLASKYGIRTPGGGASFSASALLVSESEEEVPMADGVRAVGLPGHLLKIELVNFMCHEHFTMEFGKHVTFVSGTNGSGKSAVLQALQCCLGVKASQTGRAPSFKHFVRTGTDEAIVRVTLHNKPYKDYDAFQHDVYGDFITVERRITHVGSASAYCLKDQNGRIHGRRRENLDALLHTLGINAANPVTVMTQDTARSFLAGSSTTSDREKWTLYMDATQLSQIRYNLEISKQQVTQMDAGVSKIRGEYEAMQAEHSQLQKSIEALKGLEVWRREVDQYEQVLVWAAVDEHSSNAADVEHALASAVPDMVHEAQQRLEGLSAEVEALREGTRQKEEFLLSYQQRAQDLADQATHLQAEQKDAHKKVAQARRKHAQLERELQDESVRKQSLVAAVEETCTQLAQDSQAVTLSYTRDVEQADREHKAAEAEARQHAAAKEAAGVAVVEAFNRKYDWEGMWRSCHAQGRLLQENLQQLHQAKVNSLVLFGGAPMVDLMRAIQRQRGSFHRPPIGPLGSVLTLTDPKWSTAVEAAIGYRLASFLVSDLHDCTLLQGLVTQTNFPDFKRPSVHMVRFDLPAHTIPPHKQPPAGIPTIMRVLSCNHPQQPHTVINHLVDVAGIEKIALGSSTPECRQYGFETSGVKACFGRDGSKFYSRGKSTTSMGAPHWVKFQRPRLGAESIADQVKQLREQQKQLQREEEALQQRVQHAHEETLLAENRARQCRLALQTALKHTWEAKHKLDQLLSQPPPEMRASEEAGDITEEDEVQRDIYESTQAIVDLEQQLGETQQQVEEAEQREMAARDALAMKRVEIERLNDENAQFLSTFQADVEQLQQTEAACEEAAADYAQALQSKAELEAKLEMQRAGAEACSELAAQVCSREEAAAAREELAAVLMQKEDMDEEKLAKWFTTAVMSKKIERLQKKIAEHEREAGGALADLEVTLEAIQAKMDSDGRRFRTAIGAYNLINGALQKRFTKLHELFRTVRDSVNRRFNHYMSRKGHLGSIKLDTEAQTLQLKVQIGGKAGGDGCGKVKDLKQLSGGERSFTTVAFTLALGAQTDMPFRAMDEFDVFMDAVNRRVAMESLFGFAREHDELQFIFLTPQDIAAVEDARQGCSRIGMHLSQDFVQVVQMRAARKNAQAA